MTAIAWIFRHRDRSLVRSRLPLGADGLGTPWPSGTGMQDAAKVSGVVVLALMVFRQPPSQGTDIPLWVGSGSVGWLGVDRHVCRWWRIMRTSAPGSSLTPPQGFAAETVAAITLAIATPLCGPRSRRPATITSGDHRVGTATNPRAVRWDVGRDILTAWLLLLPGAALVRRLGVALRPIRRVPTRAVQFNQDQREPISRSDR